jgi:hypothetical protein
MKVIRAFMALTASAIGICRKTALNCAARIFSRTSSGSSTLRLKKPRISHFQGYERNAAGRQSLKRYPNGAKHPDAALRASGK